MIVKASEDFKKRTLRALPTLLEKLAYISALETSAGTYEHWGLSRVFGEESAQQAIRAAHAEIACELARTPMREIYKEMLDVMAGHLRSEIMQPESFILKAPVSDDGLLSSHLRLIQDSVAALARQKSTSRQVA